MAPQDRDTSDDDNGTPPIRLAAARLDSAFMATWSAIDPKPRYYNKKVPNQYSSKLRKLPDTQLHYALLDAQEYWIEILADHCPPAWVGIASVLQQLATIIPMSAAASTRPYIALKAALKKAIHASTQAGWKDDADIRCPAVPLALLYAVKVNGSAQNGAGDMPPKITEDIAAARLDWLTHEPSESVIPKCWRSWAIRHKYPHAAYIVQQLPPAEPIQARRSVNRSSARSSSWHEDRMNIKGIPRRFSVPRPTSPELGHSRYARGNHNDDHDGMLIEDDESFELWDASFRDEELRQGPNEHKLQFELEDSSSRGFRHAGSSRSLSPEGSDTNRAESPPIDFDFARSAAVTRRPLVSSIKTDQQANVFNIKSMDDVRTLLTELQSQKPARCPTAVEVLPHAGNDVQEAFSAYTKYFGAKVKAAMKLTLGQVLLASPLAKLVKHSDAMRRDLDYFRSEAESVRQQLPEAINVVKEAHNREVRRLHKDIADLKVAVSKTSRQQATKKPQPEADASASRYQITTRAAAARVGDPRVDRHERSKLDDPPAMSTRARQMQDKPDASNASRKRGPPQYHSISGPSRKRVVTSKKAANLKTVYASYFADDD